MSNHNTLKNNYLCGMKCLDEKTQYLLRIKSGLSFAQSKDYSLLAEMILSTTGEHISDNTLRRVMGVKEDAGVPRPVTLDIIARYLGYESWNLYQRFGNEEVSDSRFIEQKNVVASSQLVIGQKLQLQYHPNRILILEYQGDEKYVVRSVSGGSLQEGDLLTIYNFVEGMTLFVSNVERKGKSLGQYLAGEVSGLLSVKLLD